MTSAPTLVVAAHGTSSVAGSRTTATLVDAIACARPDTEVRLCFLDVVAPSLASALDAITGPAVVVPLLLSTGYHVQTDIPAVVAGRPLVRVARHLGPDPLVITALADRLAGAAPASTAASTVLVGVGSSRPEARPELESAGRRLGARLGRPVRVLTLFEDVRGVVTALAGPVAVATYLLAEGHFLDRLRAAAAGVATVSEPLGAHPALVSLVLARYDAATAG
jgi:sirohydrochlorin ferrochelatase